MLGDGKRFASNRPATQLASRGRAIRSDIPPIARKISPGLVLVPEDVPSLAGRWTQPLFEFNKVREAISWKNVYAHPQMGTNQSAEIWKVNI